ncbi:MAG: hypothetical protein HY763_12375 [Planctomycetes bacterium]|nr:hypothetical protein [Planctomycetota bacterium]
MSENHIQHVQLGIVDACLSTSVPRLARDYAALYGHAMVERCVPARIRVKVRRKPFSLWHRPRFEVLVNGRLQFEPARQDELLPHVEWAVNWEIPRAFPQHLHLHAAAMEVGGAGVVFPGVSGSGKSTLAAGMLARGWRYLCDEFAIVEAQTLALQPYPRAICIKMPSFPVIESLGLRLHGRRHYLKGSKGRVGFLDPRAVRPGAVAGSCPVRFVVFPRYVAGATPQLLPLHRAEAAFALHEVCFNLLGCRTPGVDVLVRLIRQARCYRLISGDIHRTCDLLQGLVEAKGAGEGGTGVRESGNRRAAAGRPRLRRSTDRLVAAARNVPIEAPRGECGTSAAAARARASAPTTR